MTRSLTTTDDLDDAIDESLDEESSKRRFWKAFQELGRWYSALPPY